MSFLPKALSGNNSIVRLAEHLYEFIANHISSADGNVGQIGEKIGGAFSKDGAVGSQFDASKDGIAGIVEKAVDGPNNPAKK